MYKELEKFEIERMIKMKEIETGLEKLKNENI